jgi:hypothetical protein
MGQFPPWALDIPTGSRRRCGLLAAWPSLLPATLKHPAPPKTTSLSTACIPGQKGGKGSMKARDQVASWHFQNG